MLNSVSERLGGSLSERSAQLVLYALILVVAAVGLGYELALGATESFLLGDPIMQFALVIGLYMSSLGLGAFITERVQSLESRFLDVTLAAAGVGGLSTSLLFVVFAQDGPFRLVLYVVTVVLGTLIGMQVPLLMRMLKSLERFSDLIARAFAWDYVGALLGSIVFSLVLMPWLGLVRTTVAFGIFQLVSGYVVHRLVHGKQAVSVGRLTLGVMLVATLCAVWAMSGAINEMTERPL